MRKTELVLLSLATAVTMVIGSVSPVSAAARSASIPVSGVTLDNSILTITAGNSSTLTAIITPSDATNQKVSWTSSDRKVATVSSAGLTAATVTGIKLGTASITVKTADGKYTCDCRVTVVTAGQLFAEDFTGYSSTDFPAGWTKTISETVSDPDTGIWLNDAPGSYVGQTTPDLKFGWLPDYFVDGYLRASTPSINIPSTATNLSLSFKHALLHGGYNPSKTYSVSVDVSTDNGASWTPSYINSPGTNIGPEIVNVDLSPYIGNDTIMLSWHLYGYTFNSNGWFIDDIVLTGS